MFRNINSYRRLKKSLNDLCIDFGIQAFPETHARSRNFSKVCKKCGATSFMIPYGTIVVETLVTTMSLMLNQSLRPWKWEEMDTTYFLGFKNCFFLYL